MTESVPALQGDLRGVRYHVKGVRKVSPIDPTAAKSVLTFKTLIFGANSVLGFNGSAWLSDEHQYGLPLISGGFHGGTVRLWSWAGVVECLVPGVCDAVKSSV